MDGQYYCVVCAHFTSKVQKLKEREQDFNAIYGKIIDDDYLRRSKRRKKGITFNHIIFMGDLNYRVQLPGFGEECEGQFEEACDLIFEKDWDTLIAADQLGQQRKSNPRLFPGFEEIEHKWPPTYCMDRRTNEHVPTTSGGKPSFETPSYTDRILFRTCGRFVLVGDSYSPAINFLGSDHRPVNATFHIRDTARPKTIVIETNSATPASPGFEFDVDEDSLPYPHDFDCAAINGGAKDKRWENRQTDQIDSLLRDRERCCSDCAVM